MANLTNKLVAAIVNAKLTEEEILAAIRNAQPNPAAPEQEARARNKRRYNTREMRSDQTEQTVLDSNSSE